jgi:MYXO-CTERM domain-containing protein
MKLRLLLGVSVLSFGALGSSPVFGAQTDITISTAAPPAAPHILGPTVVGSKPGSPFIYTVSATGQAPLTFAATGLPAGLSIAASSGTISGTTPAAGAYPVTVTVTNAAGSATATLTVKAGDALALTPPMGWNSYDSFGSSVTESEVMSAAQAMQTELKPFGYNAVVVDFLWFDPEQAIDANGRFLPSTSKFPSSAGNQGFKPLSDKIHALGFSFGIHIMRGIPRKSVSANSPIANSTFTAAQAGNTNDPCPWDNHMWGVHGDTDAGKAWYDSIFAQYAAWGIDFVKVDDMLNPYSNPQDYHQAETDAIRAAIDKTGRSIVLSLSPGPMQTRDLANLNKNANMWRIVNDFWDTSGLSSLSDEFSATGNWQATSGLVVGHWPDADMLPLGYLGPRCPVHGSGPSALSHNQQVTVMSLWGILPSPLIFGGNPTHLSGDAWSTALLTNDEVLAVNQDSSGSHAKRIAQQGSTEVWARDLSGGRKALALFNRGTEDAMMSVDFSQLGITETPTVRDLWNRRDVTGMTTGISANVPHEGALMYTVSPPGSTVGDGGSGGSGGMATAGNGGAGGTAAGAAGTSPTGSSGSVGAGGSGAVAGSATGGLSGSSAVGGSGAGGASPPHSSATSDSGCSCSTPRSAGGPTLPILASTLLMLALRRRRQR